MPAAARFRLVGGVRDRGVDRLDRDRAARAGSRSSFRSARITLASSRATSQQDDVAGGTLGGPVEVNHVDDRTGSRTAGRAPGRARPRAPRCAGGSRATVMAWAPVCKIPCRTPVPSGAVPSLRTHVPVTADTKRSRRRWEAPLARTRRPPPARTRHRRPLGRARARRPGRVAPRPQPVPQPASPRGASACRPRDFAGRRSRPATSAAARHWGRRSVPPAKSGGGDEEPAATYSPGPLQAKYHRR